MKITRQFLTMCALLSASSCINKDSNPTSPSVIIPNNTISFDTLKIGQVSKYVAFSIVEDSIKTYIADTLILKVQAQTDSGFVIHEYYSKGSISFIRDSDIRRFLLRIINGDTVRFSLYNEPRDWGSQLMWQSATYFFPLTFQSQGTFNVDTIRPSYCMDNAFMGDVASISISSARLYNLLIFNDRGTTNADGWGFVYIYNKSSGIVMSIIYTGLSRSARGWELLLEQ
jgi:hypothetical protein